MVPQVVVWEWKRTDEARGITMMFCRGYVSAQATGAESPGSSGVGHGVRIQPTGSQPWENFGSGAVAVRFLNAIGEAGECDCGRLSRQW
jgi:hypothetical protein